MAARDAAAAADTDGADGDIESTAQLVMIKHPADATRGGSNIDADGIENLRQWHMSP